MHSFVEDMAMVGMDDASIASEAIRLTDEFGFPYKNEYGDTFHFLGVPVPRESSSVVVRLNEKGIPYYVLSPNPSADDITLVPGSVYLVKVNGASGAVDVLDEVLFSHEDNQRVAEILLSEDALSEDSPYYEEAYFEKYGDYPASDAAYSYAEFESDASRKYGVSDSVGTDFADDFLNGAASELNSKYGTPVYNYHGDAGYFVPALYSAGGSEGSIVLDASGIPVYRVGVPNAGGASSPIVQAGFVYLVGVSSDSKHISVLSAVVSGSDGYISYSRVLSALSTYYFIPDDSDYIESIARSEGSVSDSVDDRLVSDLKFDETVSVLGAAAPGYLFSGFRGGDARFVQLGDLSAEDPEVHLYEIPVAGLHVSEILPRLEALSEPTAIAHKSELPKVDWEFYTNAWKRHVSDAEESDEELLASLESDPSPKNLSRVAWILHKQGRSSLKDGRREVLAIANGPDYDKPLDYSYNQRAWTHVVDCDGVTRMSDIGSSVPGRYPANRRSSGRRK